MKPNEGGKGGKPKPKPTPPAWPYPSPVPTPTPTATPTPTPGGGGGGGALGFAGKLLSGIWDTLKGSTGGSLPKPWPRPDPSAVTYDIKRWFDALVQLGQGIRDAAKGPGGQGRTWDEIVTQALEEWAAQSGAFGDGGGEIDMSYYWAQLEFEKEKWAQQFGLTREQFEEAKAEFERTMALNEKEREDALKQWEAEYGLSKDQFAEAVRQFDATMAQTEKEARSGLFSTLFDTVMTVRQQERGSLLPYQADEATAATLGRLFAGVRGGQPLELTPLPDTSAASVAAAVRDLVDQYQPAGGATEPVGTQPAIPPAAPGAEPAGADVAGVLAQLAALAAPAGAQHGVLVRAQDGSYIAGYPIVSDATKTGLDAISTLVNLFGGMDTKFLNQLLATLVPEGTQFEGLSGGFIKSQAAREAEERMAYQRESLAMQHEATMAEVQARQADVAARLEAARIEDASRRYAAALEAGATRDAALIRSEADRYAANLQYHLGLAAENRQRAASLAEMAANPRRIFEAVAYQAGLPPTPTARQLQQRITPPASAFAPVASQAGSATPPMAGQGWQTPWQQFGQPYQMAGGGVVSGPALLVVGDKGNRGSRARGVEEFVYAPPGTVVAPARRGEPLNAVTALQALARQIAETGGA